jgi:hypothetical protein
LARKYTRPQGRTNEWLPSVRLAATELVAAAKADRERERLAAEKAGMFAIGDRVMHGNFGVGTVESVDGKKIAEMFDANGYRKIIVDSFLERAK